MGTRDSGCIYHTPWEARSPSDITNMSPSLWRGQTPVSQGLATSKGFAALPAEVTSQGKTLLPCLVAKVSCKVMKMHKDLATQGFSG